MVDRNGWKNVDQRDVPLVDRNGWIPCPLGQVMSWEAGGICCFWNRTPRRQKVPPKFFTPPEGDTDSKKV